MDEITIAESIAERFGGDGLNWRDETGCHFDVVCAMRGKFEWSGPRRGDTYRYLFPDGSAIVIKGDAWDVEGNTPFSWAGE